MQLVGSLVIASCARCDWLLQLGRWICQQLALRRLRRQLLQRLAMCRLHVPLLRFFSTQAIEDLNSALDVLNSTDASGADDFWCHVQRHQNSWRQLCAPLVSGDHAGIAAAGVLIRHGIVKPNRYGPDGDTLLHVVCRRGIISTDHIGDREQYGISISIEARIRLLVALGADPDLPNVVGEVPLQLGWERAGELSSRIASALFAAGCNPMKRDYFGMTLLHRAARSNNFAVVRSWCDAGLQTRPTGGLREGRALLQTPLMFAVMAGHRRCVEALVSSERRAIALGERMLIDGQRLVEQGRQQVGSAAARQIEEGERLMAQGRTLVACAHVSVNFADRDGATALHWAIDYGRTDLAELLEECGADRTRRAGRGAEFSWTCAQLAAARLRLQTTRPILSLLLEHRISPEHLLSAEN